MSLDGEGSGTEGPEERDPRRDLNADDVDTIDARACGANILRSVPAEGVGEDIARASLGHAQPGAGKRSRARPLGRSRGEGRAHMRGEGHLETASATRRSSGVTSANSTTALPRSSRRRPISVFTVRRRC